MEEPIPWADVEPLVLLHIARHLPRQDVLRCRAVCKSFREGFTSAIETVSILPQHTDVESCAHLRTSWPGLRTISLSAAPATAFAYAGASGALGLQAQLISEDGPAPREGCSLQRLEMGPAPNSRQPDLLLHAVEALPALCGSTLRALAVLEGGPGDSALLLETAAAAAQGAGAGGAAGAWPLPQLQPRPNTASTGSCLSPHALAQLTRLTELRCCLPQPQASSVRMALNDLSIASAASPGGRSSASSLPAGAATSPAAVLRAVPKLQALTVHNLLDLSHAETGAALASLTDMHTLSIASVFVASPHHLRPLLALTGLTSLHLGFGTEWWIHAGGCAGVN